MSCHPGRRMPPSLVASHLEALDGQIPSASQSAAELAGEALRSLETPRAVAGVLCQGHSGTNLLSQVVSAQTSTWILRRAKRVLTSTKSRSVTTEHSGSIRNLPPRCATQHGCSLLASRCRWESMVPLVGNLDRRCSTKQRKIYRSGSGRTDRQCQRFLCMCRADRGSMRCGSRPIAVRPRNCCCSRRCCWSRRCCCRSPRKGQTARARARAPAHASSSHGRTLLVQVRFFPQYPVFFFGPQGDLKFPQRQNSPPIKKGLFPNPS